ncbi:MAG: ATP-dependent Clp protease ATP-binding subunit [Oscillospiraceae bacterium]|nr:ATP-dependent Clp protease ATP-binding subunit [Oscillospiraceae bacterium]
MIHKDVFSDQTKETMQTAFRFAVKSRHSFVGSEHILWSISRHSESHAASKALHALGLDNTLVAQVIARYNQDHETTSLQVQGLSPDAERVLELAEVQARKLGHKRVDPEHILLGILQEKNCVAAKIIVSTGIELDDLASKLLSTLGKSWPESQRQSTDKKEPSAGNALAQYSRDLTLMASENKLDPVIGREEEIARLVQILSRRTKNNPVLIGEPGVGKTAIAEGLAQRIVNGVIPETLSGKRLLMLDLTKMVSGAKFRGDFEERIKGCIEEASADGNVILFIDEMHTLIGTGAAEGSMDAANILKPALSRGELQVVGATTLAEYRKQIEKDSALERRFQSIHVQEPSQEDAIQILYGLRDRYEAHHSLTITDQAIETAVKMSARYIQDRYLPDKAIDLVDEAASRLRTGNMAISPDLKELEEEILKLGAEKETAVESQLFEQAAFLRDRQNELRQRLEEKRTQASTVGEMEVTAEDIAAVVGVWTGIPVTMLTQDESERLLNLEETLHARVVGQTEAVTAVAKAIRRGRVGLKDPKRPMGAFLFLGPTGVGKTELTKALAHTIFQDENAMIRVDMSEFMERHTVSKLIGSPPGYVGYDDGGQLTEKVRRKPYSVILFDEIEKAHPDVWSILLQIMEDGRLTDAHGRCVDFKNAIIVMTSNLGARNITDGKKSLGFSADPAKSSGVLTGEELRGQVMKDLKDAFKPEFLNRIDDIIVFHQLTGEQIRQIAEIMLSSLKVRMREMGIELTVDENALALLAERGFDPKFGARPLRRVIQSAIEDAAATKLLDGKFGEGDQMLVTVRDGEIDIQKKVAAHPLALLT